MKRVAFIYSLVFISLAMSLIAFGQSNGKQSPAVKPCPFNIAGMWRSTVTSENTPIFFNFSPEGYVLLMSPSSDALPNEFEVITSVIYKLDKPAAPKNIEFTAWRGDDVFQQGVTLRQITEYSDDSFTTLDPATKEETRWVREQTHRYFLTFAARSGAPQQGGPAFAMWTVLDGRQPRVEALGVVLTKDSEDKSVATFEPIPAELYNQFVEESEEEKKKKKEETVIMRLELTQTEFEKTHKVFEQWDKYVKTRALPYTDPYKNAMELIKGAVESLNPCGEKLKLQKLNQAAIDEIVSKYNIRQQSLEYIRAMRKKNDEAHITDSMFPWSWRPMLQLSVQ